MKTIRKLNEILKYRIDINKHYMIAAICVLELYRLKNYTVNHIEDELIDRLIEQAKKEII